MNCLANKGHVKVSCFHRMMIRKEIKAQFFICQKFLSRMHEFHNIHADIVLKNDTENQVFTHISVDDFIFAGLKQQMYWNRAIFDYEASSTAANCRMESDL